MDTCIHMRQLFSKVSFQTYLIVVLGCAAFIGFYKYLDKKFKEIRTDVNYVRTQVTQLGATEDLVDSYTAADIARQVVMSAMSEQQEEGSLQDHRYERSIVVDHDDAPPPFAGADNTLLQPTAPQQAAEEPPQEGYMEYQPNNNDNSVPSVPHVLEAEEMKSNDAVLLVELD